MPRLLSLLALGQKAEGQSSLNLSQEILFIAPVGSRKRNCVEKLGARQEARFPCTDVHGMPQGCVGLNPMHIPVCGGCFCLFLIQAKVLCRSAGSLREAVEARCLWTKNPRLHPGAFQEQDRLTLNVPQGQGDWGLDVGFSCFREKEDMSHFLPSFHLFLSFSLSPSLSFFLQLYWDIIYTL